MLGTAIKIFRMTKGFRQGDFAQRVGVSPTHLSLVEGGRRRPSLPLVERIAKELGVPVGVLFSLEAATGLESTSAQPQEVERVMRLLLRALELVPPQREVGTGGSARGRACRQTGHQEAGTPRPQA